MNGLNDHKQAIGKASQKPDRGSRSGGAEFLTCRHTHACRMLNPGTNSKIGRKTVARWALFRHDELTPLDLDDHHGSHIQAVVVFRGNVVYTRDTHLARGLLDGRTQVVGVDAVLYYLDADQQAREMDDPRSVNLIMLGFALASNRRGAFGHDGLYCSPHDVEAVLEIHLKGKDHRQKSSLRALKAGAESAPAA